MCDSLTDAKPFTRILLRIFETREEVFRANPRLLSANPEREGEYGRDAQSYPWTDFFYYLPPDLSDPVSEQSYELIGNCVNNNKLYHLL